MYCISAGTRSIFCSYNLNALIIYRLNSALFFSVKMITSSKLINRIFAKLKNIVHNNRAEIIFNFISFNRKVLYISFVYCEGVISLQTSFEVWSCSHRKLFSKLVLIFCYFYCSKFCYGTSSLKC